MTGICNSQHALQRGNISRADQSCVPWKHSWTLPSLYNIPKAGRGSNNVLLDKRRDRQSNSSFMPAGISTHIIRFPVCAAFFLDCGPPLPPSPFPSSLLPFSLDGKEGPINQCLFAFLPTKSHFHAGPTLNLLHPSQSSL